MRYSEFLQLKIGNKSTNSNVVTLTAMHWKINHYSYLDFYDNTV